MDHMITTALHAHAEGDVHVERLLDSVRAGARRQRRRRIAVGCGAALTVVALIGAVGGLVRPDPRPVPWTGAPPGVGSPVALPRPPGAPGAPTVAEQPAALGSGPGLFHLDLDLDGLTGWSFASWAAGGRSEELTVVAGETGGTAYVVASRDPEWLGAWGPGTSPTTVAGLPAEIRELSGSHLVRWQPMPGVWAQVQANGMPDFAIRVAEKVRFDRVYRCAVPYRMTGLASPVLRKCSTDFALDNDGETVIAGGTTWVTLTEGGPEYQVSVGRSAADTVVNDTIGGRAVQVIPPPADGSRPPEIRYPYDGRTAYFWQFAPFAPADLRSVAAAFVPVAGRDPAGWPTTPF
jgi:hypothetical protein